jgi:glutathionyl-hydroquinone reductase
MTAQFTAETGAGGFVRQPNRFTDRRSKLSELPFLWRYARRLFQTTGFGETVDFDQIKRHYYATHDAINPTRIVPK